VSHRPEPNYPAQTIALLSTYPHIVSLAVIRHKHLSIFVKIQFQMRKMTTHFAAIVCLLLSTTGVQSQLFIQKDGAVLSAIEKVLAALPGQLQPITGPLINNNPQSREYESKVLLPGSVSNYVVQYASVDNKKTIAAWHSIVMETEAFAAASKKFKWLYHQIKSGVYKCSGKSLRLTAPYESPKEEISFTSIVFEEPGKKGTERIELSMQYAITNWTIKLTVYNQDRELETLVKHGPSGDNDY
jgi:hypothetical protein